MIPESIDDLSVIATNNVPQGGDNVGGTLDDILRAHATIMKRDLALKKAETAEGTSFTPTDRLISKNVQAALVELGEKIGDINLEWSEIKGKPPTFAPSAHNHSWAEITGKPSNFTPSSHTHAWSQVSGIPATATRWPSWGEVTGKPSNFTPSSHTHAWSQVSGIPATATRWPSWGEVTGKPSTFTPPTGQGAVGTYAWVQLRFNISTKAPTTVNWGQTVAGSDLRVSRGSPILGAIGPSLSGTWRIMGGRTVGGYTNSGQIQEATLAVRIS
ncbi:hypothetical protein [Oligella urethralis]|uniref:hypothetical protein n=1 Tax=Oligella urethralis TaxID=90245 RepID=UPI000DFBF69A|nr:hypothetical protein [Oligella urethralis]SUA58337.1 Uncharacterised protein [Oligella urethralis]